MKKQIILILIISLFLITSCSILPQEASQENVQRTQEVVKSTIEVEEPVVEIQEPTQVVKKPTPIQETQKQEEPQTLKVTLTNGGFNPELLTIEVGQTVLFENVRTGKIKQAMIIGNRECRHVRSTTLNPKDTFEHTFEKEMSCIITDAFLSNEELRIVVTG